METEMTGFRYRFDFGDGEEKVFEAQLEQRTLKRVLTDVPSELPEWTRLTHKQCSNCPLSEETHPYCPAAVSLADVVKFFDQSITRRMVTVRIESHARTYEKQTSLQEALSSLVGLCMAGSDCPVLEKLRPLLVVHLPFATMDETVFRVVSMYLLAQLLISRKQGQPDWELKGLSSLYEEVHTVNQHFHERLADVSSEDASPAALVMLDLFSQSMSFVVGDEELAPFESYFASYLKDL